MGIKHGLQLLASSSATYFRTCRGRLPLLASAAHQHGSGLFHRARDFPHAAGIRLWLGSTRAAATLEGGQHGQQA